MTDRTRGLRDRSIRRRPTLQEIAKNYPNITKFLTHRGEGHCGHDGPCTKSVCPCFNNQTTCERACQCWPTCVRGFPTCACEGECVEGCHCFELSRECTPGLCTCIKCKNILLEPPKCYVAPSTIAGLGLFARQAVIKGEYIGEYQGKRRPTKIIEAELKRRQSSNNTRLLKISTGEPSKEG